MRATFIALCAAALGCGSSTTQGNSQPEGFIAGRVLDAATGAPAAGVEVSTFANTKEVTATTDMDGRYQLGPIPAGSYTVFAEASGFVRRIFTGVTIAGAAGNYPTGNVVLTRDFDMSKGDAVIDGQVITSASVPAKDAALFIDLRSASFDIVQALKTDAMGKFRIPNLPGAAGGVQVTVNVAPYDENMDGLPDYNSGSRTYTLFPGFTATGSITISAVGIPVLSSNVADGDLAPMEAITMSFGAQVRPSQSTFTLSRGGFQLGLDVTWDSSETTATVRPAGGPLLEGFNHQLGWTVRGVNGSSSSGNQSFVVRSSNVTPPGNVTNFRVTSPSMMQYDAQTSSVTLGWDAVNGVTGYRIYGKDTQANPAYVMLQQFSSQMTIAGTVSLSGSTFGMSGVPLGGGNKITLAIVALGSSMNEGPLAAAPTLELSDNTPPTVISGSQLSGFGQLNNTAGSSPVTGTFRVSFSEPMNQSMNPVLQPSDVRVTSTFAWSSATVGTFTITVPPGANGAGQIGVTGGRDTSNNAQTMAYMGSLN